ncbi:hypothetical protein KC19_4G239700 [Ceratodon purpureus]|uniref:Uncharacterized protein n=1 Tax=Ceratodon purpureus TaxID=3225 RepID=A0A8T0IEH3_CERPU|nr:hypothetical protein KC19_4G239700 [Ceratodon purpureus]
MAAVSMVSGSVVAAPLSATTLSSSVAFGASQAQFAPVCNVSTNGGRVVAVKASYSEEESSVTKRVLSSVLATGLAISLAGSAFAASGPGGDGAERTARKADELLQGADALIKNDSPQRFGPERGFGNGTDKADEDRFSQKAGSGAIPELQDATSAQVSGARDKFASNVKKTQRRIDGIWGMGKGMANDVVADAQGKVDDAAKGAKRAFGQATKNTVASNVKSSAGNVAADVKSKADEVAAPVKSSSGGFFGKIKQQAKGIQGAVASKGADVQNAIPNVGK